MYPATAIHRIHETVRAASVRFAPSGNILIVGLLGKDKQEAVPLAAATTLGWQIEGLDDLIRPLEGLPASGEWVHLDLVGIARVYSTREHRWQVARKIKPTGDCELWLIHRDNPDVRVQTIIPYGLPHHYYIPPRGGSLGTVIVNVTEQNYDCQRELAAPVSN